MRVEMYVTRTCGYCVRARALLQKKGVAWEEHNISGQPALADEMVRRSGGRMTVPQIFIGDIHVGGCDDLYQLDALGRLDPLLERLSA